MNETNDWIWNEITAREGKVFTTHRGKDFTFHLRKTKYGESKGEIEIDRGRIVISRVTAMLACHQAREIQEKKGYVKSPGKLGTHGAVYLYPILIDMGVCSPAPGAKLKASTGAEPQMDAGIITESETPEAVPAVKHCAYCGYTTEEDFGFCPKCGRKF